MNGVFAVNLKHLLRMITVGTENTHSAGLPSLEVETSAVIGMYELYYCYCYCYYH